MKTVITLIEEGLSPRASYVERHTVRAIIKDQGKIMMAYARYYDDYTFPGGGIKEGETPENALRRELNEELGAYGVTIIEVFMTTEELKYSIRGDDTVFLQTSTFYLCTLEGYGQARPQVQELMHGLDPVMVDPKDALTHNQKVMNDDKHSKKGMRTVLRRENAVLEALIKEREHESI
ncbi:MAG: NUDIX domain-containing protein [Acholeplasmataceae bacterium]|nr:NUDIX domain-containing protein [Acholeplasmataceae bacterium]